MDCSYRFVEPSTTSDSLAHRDRPCTKDMAEGVKRTTPLKANPIRGLVTLRPRRSAPSLIIIILEAIPAMDKDSEAIVKATVKATVKALVATIKTIVKATVKATAAMIKATVAPIKVTEATIKVTVATITHRQDSLAFHHHCLDRVTSATVKASQGLANLVAAIESRLGSPAPRHCLDRLDYSRLPSMA